MQRSKRTRRSNQTPAGNDEAVPIESSGDEAAGSSSNAQQPNPAATRAKAREYICTIPETAFQQNDLQQLLQESNVAHAVWQLEEGGNTGYQHYQLYVRFNSPRSFNGVRTMFKNSHVEVVKETEAAIRYCSKQPTRISGPFTLGTAKKQGTRNDIKAFADTVASGAADAELWTEHPECMYKFCHRVDWHRAALNLLARRRASCSIYVFWGPSGSGKSARAFQMAPTAYRLAAPPTDNQGLWWDGYAGQDQCILEEFTSWIKITTLLTWLDIYPAQVQIKGGYRPLLVTTWYLTSNIAPEDWYPNANQSQRDALLQRLYHGRGADGRGTVVQVTDIHQKIDGVPDLNF